MVSPEDEAMQERAREAREEALARVRLRIKARMAETGISMAKLAIRANVSPRTVQRFLAEPDRDVHLGTVASIAAILLVDVKDLFETGGE